jgi:3-oxoacyl-[acyl-carrier protein] reductase
MTRIMAKELATQGIRVNAISPGATGTELFNKTNSVDTIQKIASGNPFNRTADPDEIAEAVSLLWKNESRWITEQVVKVDGGSA